MEQNPIYVASGGAKNNRIVAEAKAAERKLASVRMYSLGIVADGTGGQRIEFLDFEEHEINPELPANLLIRLSWGNQSTEENSIPDHGEFVNVDRVLDCMKKAATPLIGISQLIAQFNPGISDQEVASRIDGMPGVGKAKLDAVVKAWDAA